MQTTYQPTTNQSISVARQTRNSAITDKPRDAFVQMQWRGWPSKTSPSPYMLPCRISSFCVKGCRHKYRRTDKIGQPWNSTLLEWEAWLTQDTRPYHVKFGSSATTGVRLNRKEPLKLGSAGTNHALGWRIGWTSKNKPLFHMCNHFKFGSSASKGVYINRRELQSLGSAWAPPPCCRASLLLADPL